MTRAPIAAIVLAAGLSRRSAPHNKLLVPDAGGVPMIVRTVDAVLASGAAPVFVVVGHQAALVRAALGLRPVTYVTALDYESGMAASLRAGISALPPEVGGALICLGDMPLVRPETMDLLLAAHAPAAGRGIVLPVHGGRRGNPVLWDRAYFPALRALTGDSGARGLLPLHAADIAELPVEDDGVLHDFDMVAGFTSATG